MKILLDNCVKKELLPLFQGHEAVHSSQIRWSDLKNGELLKRADAQFDVMVTIDKNMRFQSSLKGLRLRVAVLNVRGNLIEQLIPAVERLLATVETLPEGQFTVIQP